MTNKEDIVKQIAIVIITKDRYKDLSRTLTKLGQLEAKFKIVVVDNNSTDGTPEKVKSNFPNVELIALNYNAGAIGRNIGVEKAGTPFIAFNDDDSWWEKGMLTKAITYFKAYSKVAIICGKVLIDEENRVDPFSHLLANSPLPKNVAMPGPSILGFMACAIFVRTEAYLKVGGFNKWLDFSGEEQILAVDLVANGWGITYCEDLITHHYPSKRNKVWRNQLNIRNNIWFAWLRLRAKKAFIVTIKEISKAIKSPNLIKGVLMAFSKFFPILKDRKVIPDYLEENLRMLEDQEGS